MSVHARPHRLHAAILTLILVVGLASLAAAEVGPLTAPAQGKIRVAFLLGPHATMIDFAGPWEVFQDVHVHDRGPTMDDMMPFALYTVAESKNPIVATGGMTIVPDHSFADAPAPDVVVIPASGAPPEAAAAWLRKVAPDADIVMSVCTGAFHLARSGLLDGLPATTHHDFVDQLEKTFPKVKVTRDRRFIDNGRVATAAGLTSGIDLALHVVERYFGREVAETTATYMEHHSTDWKD